MPVIYGTPLVADEPEMSAVIDVNSALNQVSESAPVGTAVGIHAYAEQAGETITYSLSDDSGGLFTIDSSGVVRTAGALSYNTASTHTVTVLATSSRDGTAEQAFTISVLELESMFYDGEDMTFDGEPMELV